MKSGEAHSGHLSKARFFSLIVDHVPAGIALLRGPDFTFEVVNPAYAAIAPGVPMLGKTVAEVFPDASGFVVPLLRRVLESGEPFGVEDQALTIRRSVDSPPETAYFSFSYTRVMDGRTPATHSVLVLALETTAKKKAEEERERAGAELQLQRRIFDTALSNTPDATYVLSPGGRFIYANRTLLARLDKPLSEVVGRNLFELNYPSDLATRFHRQVDSVIQTGSPVSDQTPITLPSGVTRQYEYILVPVFAGSGEVEAVAGSSRDITERKLAEEKERARQEQLRESARLESLGVMAGGIAHDFNNLLTGILGNASLLAESAQGEERAIAGQISLAAERAADLTSQMLAFSGKGRFAVEVVDLNALVRENLTLLRASLSRTVSVDLELDCDDCFVEAGRAQLQQVIMNLLINASESMDGRPGKVEIRTALIDRASPKFSVQTQALVPPGRYAVLEVRDNGSGMKPETLKRIFDPFFTTKFTGRGLGLAAVLGIIKGHRGDIEVVTEPDHGSLFRIILPATKPAAPERRGPAVATAARADGQTVLVVDDEELVRTLAAAALERRGFRVVTAGNGAEALEVLRGDSTVAAVILDLTMPVMTGEQAIPRIQAICPGLPIILSSGFSEAEVWRRFASSGIAAVLQKPYTAGAIVAKVMDALQESGQGLESRRLSYN